MSIRSNVDARRLNERIALQRRSVAEVNGDPVTTWTGLGTFWAAIDATKASERWQQPLIADATQQVSDLTVWVRADVVESKAIRESDRVLWKGKVLDIVDILDQQRRGRLVALICREGLNNG